MAKRYFAGSLTVEGYRVDIAGGMFRSNAELALMPDIEDGLCRNFLLPGVMRQYAAEVGIDRPTFAETIAVMEQLYPVRAQVATAIAFNFYACFLLMLEPYDGSRHQYLFDESRQKIMDKYRVHNNNYSDLELRLLEESVLNVGLDYETIRGDQRVLNRINQIFRMIFGDDRMESIDEGTTQPPRTLRVELGADEATPFFTYFYQVRGRRINKPPALRLFRRNPPNPERRIQINSIDNEVYSVSRYTQDPFEANPDASSLDDEQDGEGGDLNEEEPNYRANTP